MAPLRGTRRLSSATASMAVALGLAVSLAACGGEDEPAPSSDPVEQDAQDAGDAQDEPTDSEPADDEPGGEGPTDDELAESLEDMTIEDMAPDTGEDTAPDTGGGELASDMPDFPIPQNHTVEFGQEGGAERTGDGGEVWTVRLTTTDDWEDVKAFYEEELPAAGWSLDADRPFVMKEGTELDATKDDMEVTVGISFVTEDTSLIINLIRE